MYLGELTRRIPFVNRIRLRVCPSGATLVRRIGCHRGVPNVPTYTSGPTLPSRFVQWTRPSRKSHRLGCGRSSDFRTQHWPRPYEVRTPWDTEPSTPVVSNRMSQYQRVVSDGQSGPLDQEEGGWQVGRRGWGDGFFRTVFRNGSGVERKISVESTSRSISRHPSPTFHRRLPFRHVPMEKSFSTPSPSDHRTWSRRTTSNWRDRYSIRKERVVTSFLPFDSLYTGQLETRGETGWFFIPYV